MSDPKVTVPSDEELLQLAMTWNNHVGNLVETLFSEYKEVRDRTQEATLNQAADIVIDGATSPFTTGGPIRCAKYAGWIEGIGGYRDEVRRIMEESHAK